MSNEPNEMTCDNCGATLPADKLARAAARELAKRNDNRHRWNSEAARAAAAESNRRQKLRRARAAARENAAVSGPAIAGTLDRPCSTIGGV